MGNIIKCVCEHIAGLHQVDGQCAKCGCKVYRPQEPGSLDLSALDGDGDITDLSKYREVKHGLLDFAPDLVSRVQDRTSAGGAVRPPEREPGEVLLAVRGEPTTEAGEPGEGPQPGVKASQWVTQEAQEYVTGPRQSAYGHPRVNFKRIARLWSAYLQNQDHPSLLDEEDIALMMMLLKVARLQAGYHRDSLVDIVGYALTLQMIRED